MVIGGLTFWSFDPLARAYSTIIFTWQCFVEYEQGDKLFTYLQKIDSWSNNIRNKVNLLNYTLDYALLSNNSPVHH